jgi:hypothetical protein
MALVVEDGTGKVDAESYVSIAEVNDYATKHGKSFPIAGEAAAPAEAAARRATIWLDGVYGSGYPGRAASTTQALEWPRKGATFRCEPLAEDLVPSPIKKACCEAAIRELATPGALSPDVTLTDRVVREKVGDLEVQYAASGGVDAARPVVLEIEAVLAGLLQDAAAYEPSWLWR